MSGTIIYEKTDGIARLTLNRPAVLNALNLEMRDELWDALRAFRDDPDARVLILRGAGKAFSAGADISDFGTAPSLAEARRARRERDVWDLLLHLPKPTIAAVHGHALGAGCEMALLCDLRIAADDASFGLPEVGLGYIPSAGGTQTLPRTIPPGVAMQMILSGDPIDADVAQHVLDVGGVEDTRGGFR
ncbi:MAG: enoyl-CoA hydratase/isomerase family protein [Chloroflexi bacterium]|nr:enoyl-CoA hydratase/isomerase family protein [Chloroflexota bacterium]